MKRTGMRLTAVAAVTALLLGGCGEQPYSLTEDEEGMIVDYSAHAVAKFNTSQPDGLANVTHPLPLFPAHCGSHLQDRQAGSY